MKKTLLFVFILLFSVSLFGCANTKNEAQAKENTQQNATTKEQAVKNLVENFGQKLQLVSLLSPDVTESLQENYGDLVTPELLAKWQSDPGNAPGRSVSSPWPDRIEIQSITKTGTDSYEVKGEIIEITNVEKEKGGAAAKRPIDLTVKKINGQWLIDSVTLGAYQATASILYDNTQYGFAFTLPQSWEGYSIITDKWQGLDIDSQKAVESGPLISIRHPQWTSQEPRQDIPIMVFTLAQWNALQKEAFHIGAAPIGPSEFGRNSQYVFALPARYNFAFPTGYEEVEDIINSHPLQPTEPTGQENQS